MPINRGTFGAALWPGINTWYGLEYKQHPELFTQLFDSFNSNKAFEEDVLSTGLGLISEKTEGGAVQYDTVNQGFKSRYNMVTYGGGFIVTREMYEDDQYNLIEKYSRNQAQVVRKTKEYLAANVYNRAFNSSYTGGDGIELLATNHPNVSGGTYANELTTAADLSEAALEQAIIDISKFKDDRGQFINTQARKLIIPPDLQFEAERILMSVNRVGTTNNDINALKNMGILPDGVVVNPYLTDTDAWFIRTDVMDGMKYWQRRADEFMMDNDFDTENAKYKTTFRCAFGWTDPKGLFGSPGAA